MRWCIYLDTIACRPCMWLIEVEEVASSTQIEFAMRSKEDAIAGTGHPGQTRIGRDYIEGPSGDLCIDGP
ncbi:hypothetical protein DOTSEDRAFT_67483 [Dothistroma septosporum NZE10]|uniref:Uncharacterized protein n=1 Tax=Dothistroma septosporum (strain NZE10 / CBS 128990) TaxID=675120 RepID=N1PZL7_DOTSN|nr:hypothetical protein DOTSEDRAFT_67483 [Dothistroma septosporum NZE10]